MLPTVRPFRDPSLLNLGVLFKKYGLHQSAKFSFGWLLGIDVRQQIVWKSEAYNILSIAFFAIKKRKLCNIS
jgi:hypothetical protein